MLAYTVPNSSLWGAHRHAYEVVWIPDRSLSYELILNPYEGIPYHKRQYGIVMGGEAIVGPITRLPTKPLSLTYYNACSPQSCVDELSRQVFCCKGTIRANINGNCPTMDAECIGRANHTFYTTDYVEGLVTAMYNAQCWQRHSQQLWDQTRADIDQMVCKRVRSSHAYGIIDFNQCMGGVDRVYQHVGKCICRIG